jgi:hypothetical protein
MKNLKPVYICDDYNIKNRILIIDKPILIGLVNNIDQLNELIENEIYDEVVVVCPDLYKKIDCYNFDYVKFNY